MSSRDDVATFLLDKLDASVDIADYDGISPAMMATSGGVVAELMSPAAAVVKRAMTERGKVQARAERRKCANCKKPEEGEHFNKCSKCMVARYCSRDCQGTCWLRIDTFCVEENNFPVQYGTALHCTLALIYSIVVHFFTDAPLL
jgi:hypothetical protein